MLSIINSDIKNNKVTIGYENNAQILDMPVNINNIIFNENKKIINWKYDKEEGFYYVRKFDNKKIFMNKIERLPNMKETIDGKFLNYNTKNKRLYFDSNILFIDNYMWYFKFYKKNWFVDEKGVYYKSNTYNMPKYIVEIIFKLDQGIFNWKFKNNNIYDYRKENIMITQQYEKIPNGMQIIKGFSGHLPRGTTNKIPNNPYWLVEKINKDNIAERFYIMYCNERKFSPFVYISVEGISKILYKKSSEGYEGYERYTWYFDTEGYCQAAVKINDLHTKVCMHRILMDRNIGINDKLTVDHINRIKHDNRYLNLRLLDQSGQNANRDYKRELPKYVHSYTEIYDKKNDKKRYVLQIEGHPYPDANNKKATTHKFDDENEKNITKHEICMRLDYYNDKFTNDYEKNIEKYPLNHQMIYFDDVMKERSQEPKIIYDFPEKLNMSKKINIIHYNNNTKSALTTLNDFTIKICKEDYAKIKDLSFFNDDNYGVFFINDKHDNKIDSIEKPIFLSEIILGLPVGVYKIPIINNNYLRENLYPNKIYNIPIDIVIHKAYYGHYIKCYGNKFKLCNEFWLAKQKGADEECYIMHCGNGKYTTFSKEDATRIIWNNDNRRIWTYHKGFVCAPYVNGEKIVYMHNIINGKQTLHKTINTFDNQRKNLFTATDDEYVGYTKEIEGYTFFDGCIYKTYKHLVHNKGSHGHGSSFTIEKHPASQLIQRSSTSSKISTYEKYLDGLNILAKCDKELGNMFMKTYNKETHSSQMFGTAIMGYIRRKKIIKFDYNNFPILE